MGNKPSVSSRSLLTSNDVGVKILTKNIDGKLKNLTLEEWKKEILKNKKRTSGRSDDEKDDRKHDDYEELISYLEKPSFVSNSVSIVSIIARLIRIYSGNVVAKNLYNDKESGQLEGYKISMAIHPLNCDIYITDSQTIFRLETTLGSTKDENSCKNGCLVPIFRLPSHSSKLTKMKTTKEKISSITDISIDSGGKFLFYVVNSNYLKTYLLDIENITNINNSNGNDYSQPREKTNVKTKAKTKEKTRRKRTGSKKDHFKTTVKKELIITMVDRSGIDNKLEWDQLCFNKSIDECNFNHLNATRGVGVGHLSTYDSCRDLFWYKETLNYPGRPRLFYDREDKNDICVDTRRMIVCARKQCFLDQLCVINEHERKMVHDVFHDAYHDLYNGNGSTSYQDDQFYCVKKKYNIPFATIIKHYCEEYCVKCANNESKDYKKLYDKLCDEKYNKYGNSLSLDDVSNMKCICDDFIYDIMALGIDKYYNAIYIILKSKMLYRLGLNKKKNANLNSKHDNCIETKESQVEKKEMEKDGQALSKEQEKFKSCNTDWCVTHRVNLREELKDTGGTPIGLCVIQYDSVLGRLIIADNFNIQALYI